jgi:hypothetical protein
MAEDLRNREPEMRVLSKNELREYVQRRVGLAARERALVAEAKECDQASMMPAGGCT